MKRIITLIIACCLLFGLCACGSSSSEKEAHPGESVVKKALKAGMEVDIAAYGSCFPEEVRQYHTEQMRHADFGPEDTRSVKVSVRYVRELSDDEIQSLIAEYEHEAGAYLEIEEAHLYEGTVSWVWAEDNRADSNTGSGLSVKIRGKWYALAQHI